MVLASLRGQGAFKRVAMRGRRCHSNGLLLMWLFTGSDFNRYGIAARLKVGNAVTRNRVRRWTRELLRHWQGSLEDGYDVVISAQMPQAAESFAEYAGHLGRALKKAELIQDVPDLP